MILYLTSHIGGSDKASGERLPAPLLEDNGFADGLRARWKEGSRVLLIASAPLLYEGNAFRRELFVQAFAMTGLSVARMDMLDARTTQLVEHLQDYEAIVLFGGHVPTQNAFFHEIGLAARIKAYDGIVMGISAGTMNCAEVVYAHPEEEGEAIDPAYARFLEGLALTQYQILPHFQYLRTIELDGLDAISDIAMPDSMGRAFYCLNDGSYILCENGVDTLYGEGYLMRNGELTQLCRHGEHISLQ